MVSQGVQECSVSKQHTSLIVYPRQWKIVTKANQRGAVSLFRSSFETEEILTGWFSSNIDGLSQKN